MQIVIDCAVLGCKFAAGVSQDYEVFVIAYDDPSFAAIAAYDLRRRDKINHEAYLSFLEQIV